MRAYTPASRDLQAYPTAHNGLRITVYMRNGINTPVFILSTNHLADSVREQNILLVFQHMYILQPMT